MARSMEHRRTVRTSTTRTGANEIKENLTNVASEIARVSAQARQEVESLERIRGMLGTGYFENLLSSIEELETRIEELENSTLEARGDVDRAQAELNQEQERLKKLWDAYKSQEDELDRLKRDYPLMEEKLFERERLVEQQKREIVRLEGLSKYKEDYENLLRDHRALETETGRMEKQLQKSQDHIQRMEGEIVQLREVEADAGRVQELEGLLDEERERLAKLYRVYEDLEQEKKDSDVLLEEWAAWAKQVKPVLQDACNVLDSAPA